MAKTYTSKYLTGQAVDDALDLATTAVQPGDLTVNHFPDFVGPPGAEGPPGADGQDGATGEPGPPGPAAVSAGSGNVLSLGEDDLPFYAGPEAAAVAFTPTATLEAANVQAAIEELDEEKTGVDEFQVLQQQVNDLANTEVTQGQGTYLVSGATVAWVTGYTYLVGAATYRIGGVECASAAQTVTLDAAHETLPRIDVLVLDANGTLSAVAGIPSESPAQPTVEPDAYYVVTLVVVAAASTEPDVVNTNIYTEGSEWTATPSVASITVGSTNNPRTGTVCIEGTNVANGAYLTFVSSVALDPNAQNNLVFYIRNKAGWTTRKSLRLTWYYGTTKRGNSLTVGDGSYGLNTQATGSYQQVVIPMSAFVIPAGLSVDRLRWEIVGSGENIGFYLDDMLLQAGISGQQAPVMLYAGEWLGTRVYTINQIVTYNGDTYIALAASLNENPATSSLWGVVAEESAVTLSAQSTLSPLKIAVVAALPGSPDASTLYFVTGS